MPLVEHPDVVSVGIGGSTVRGTSDRQSDLDFFVYVDDSVLCADWAQQAFAPQGARVQQKSFRVEMKYCVDGRAVDVKFFPKNFVLGYQGMSFSTDDAYLEQVENLMSVSLVKDSHRFIRTFREIIRAKMNDSLVSIFETELVSHYGDKIWHTVIQAVFRDESVSAYNALWTALNTLTKLTYLAEGLLPTPTKWRYSKRALDRVDFGSCLIDLSVELTKLNMSDREAVLNMLTHFRSAEDELFPIISKVKNSHRYWWSVLLPDTMSDLNVPEHIVQVVQSTFPSELILCN